MLPGSACAPQNTPLSGAVWGVRGDPLTLQGIPTPVLSTAPTHGLYLPVVL